MSGIGIHNTNIYFLYGRITAQEWKRTLNVVLKYSIPPAATLDVMQNTRNETLETHTQGIHYSYHHCKNESAATKQALLRQTCHP